MWPFRRRKQADEKKGHFARRVIVGLVIGGAISSIIGAKLMDKKEKEREEEDDEKEKGIPQ